MRELTVHVDGSSLRGFGGYGQVKMTTTARGCGVLSWQMETTRHRPMDWAVDSPVQAKVGGGIVWTGLLGEPGADGTFYAYGLPALADGTPALDSAGAPTNNATLAVSAARDRGSLPGWAFPPFLGSLGDEPQERATIAALLDGITAGQGHQWTLSPDGVVSSYSLDAGTPAIPGGPQWHVNVPGYRYGYDTTDLVTDLYATYWPSAGVTAVTHVTVGTSTVHREEWVPLEDFGVMSEAQAQATLLNLAVAQGMATPAPTEPINLGWGQLQTSGGTSVPAWMVRGGDAMRVWGATDGRGHGRYRDFRVDSTEYDDETGEVKVTLAHAKPRGFGPALEALFAA